MDQEPIDAANAARLAELKRLTDEALEAARRELEQRGSGE
jgi:hypothetical protein